MCVIIFSLLGKIVDRNIERWINIMIVDLLID